MLLKKTNKILTATALTLSLGGYLSAAEGGDPASHDWERGRIRHVLLISIDGMHAVDYLNCRNGVAGVNGGAAYCPNLAALGATGINYTAASASKPSDSFPGLMAIVSGGTPRSVGAYYDVAYDRSLDPPAKATGNGVAAGACTSYGTPSGTTTEYEEGIDLDQSFLNGGIPNAALTDGGIVNRWWHCGHRRRAAAKRSSSQLRSGLPLEFRSHEHHLRRYSPSLRLYSVDRQAPLLFVSIGTRRRNQCG